LLPLCSLPCLNSDMTLCSLVCLPFFCVITYAPTKMTLPQWGATAPVSQAAWAQDWA
jgi:hypothetical protein